MNGNNDHMREDVRERVDALVTLGQPRHGPPRGARSTRMGPTPGSSSLSPTPTWPRTTTMTTASGNIGTAVIGENDHGRPAQ
ncbi:hypothetical protein [Streptomyces sp. PanSC19]|uniref:hypothetical protein n=1 Tax=Streptomyces sp. PanSC19 TaxID=1520455 RepID=UPI0011CD54D1|nr:hypothetical protein [Streptomyces sp. PanSC19]